MKENVEKILNTIPRMFRGIAMNALAQCKTPEEIITLASNYGIKLSPEDAKDLFEETRPRESASI